MNNISKNIILSPFNLLYRINPELELRLMFRLKHGYALDLKNPRSFNEKLQWLKLYDRNELKPKCCDKYAVREYVEEMGCQDILNTLYWHGTDPDQIPYDSLPDRFVIKVTHGSTFNIIVKDKSQLDRKDVSRKLRKWLKAKFLPCYGEWYYGVVPPQIIVEQYLDDGHPDGLLDYKVFCFNGKAQILRVHTGRFEGHGVDVYDLNWQLLRTKFSKYPDSSPIDKPALFDELIKRAETLASPFCHARVDFYIADNRLYFGEITFASGSGYTPIAPFEDDLWLGSFLELPINEN